MAYDICPDCGRSVPIVQSRMMDRCGAVGPVNYCDCPCGNVWEVKQKLQVVPSARGRDYVTAQDGDLIIVTRPDGYSYSTGVREVLDCCHYIDHHGNTQHISQTVRNDYRRDPERTKVEIIKGGMRQVSPNMKMSSSAKREIFDRTVPIGDPLFRLALDIVEFYTRIDDDPYGLIDSTDGTDFADAATIATGMIYQALQDDPQDVKRQLRQWELEPELEGRRANLIRQIDAVSMRKRIAPRRKATSKTKKKTASKNKREVR